MTKHIGIVGCSYEGAALCYRTICQESPNYLGRHNHPEISLHNYPLSEYMIYIKSGDWDGVAKLMLSSEKKLEKMGVDFIICPDNTIHQAFFLLENDMHLPWLHIAQEVAKKAVESKYKKVGILGTKFLMEGPVYTEKFEKANIYYCIPEEEQRIKINSIIFNELVYGILKQESKEYFLSVINNLKSNGCDSVVLGCTEIPLIVLPEDSSLPVLDSTRILARAALKYAVE